MEISTSPPQDVHFARIFADEVSYIWSQYLLILIKDIYFHVVIALFVKKLCAELNGFSEL